MLSQRVTLLHTVSQIIANTLIDNSHVLTVSQITLMNTLSKTISHSHTTSQTCSCTLIHPQNNAHGPNSMTTTTCSDTDTPSQIIAALLDIGMVSWITHRHTLS